MRLSCLALPALCAAMLLPLQAQADADPADIDALFDAMSLAEMLEIMQAEGLDYGDKIAEDLFPDRPTEDWSQTVAQIIATQRDVAKNLVHIFRWFRIAIL